MVSGKNNMSNSKKLFETVFENIQILENNLNIFEIQAIKKQLILLENYI